MRISELARRAGATPRTVRFYVAEGLLPPPSGRGAAADYGYDHLVRLAAIRALKAGYLPLAEVRRRLAGLSTEEVEALAVAPGDPTAVLDAVSRPLATAAPSSPRGPRPRPDAPTGRGAAACRQPGAGPGPAAGPAGERTPAQRTGAHGAAHAFALPSAQREPLLGAAVAAPSAPELWQRIDLAPGVELSFRPNDDPARARAIADLINEARRRLASP